MFSYQCDFGVNWSASSARLRRTEAWKETLLCSLDTFPFASSHSIFRYRSGTLTSSSALSKENTSFTFFLWVYEVSGWLGNSVSHNGQRASTHPAERGTWSPRVLLLAWGFLPFQSFLCRESLKSSELLPFLSGRKTKRKKKKKLLSRKEKFQNPHAHHSTL